MRYLYRKYCKNCNDYTIHDIVFVDEFKHELYSKVKFNEDEKHVDICDCGYQYQPTQLSEIEDEKIKKQRSRYKRQSQEQFAKAYGMYINFTLTTTPSLGLETKNTSKIIEDDAGLKEEREQEMRKEEEIKRNKEVVLEKYKNVGRNDKCLCGSGLKYKNCCLKVHKTF